MTDHPQNTYLKPARQISDNKSEGSLSRMRKAAERLLAEKKDAYAERWKPRCKALQTFW